MTVSFGSLQIRFVPIATWPGPRTRARQSSPFRASWSVTLELLRKELRALRAKDVLLQTFHTDNQIRQDGLPYANARTPDDPGVILTFESKHGPLSFPCDTYRDWQDNVRAIALAMEKLRAVDRYGVTKTGEQYRGWKALPGAGGSSDTMTAQAAAELVARLAGNSTVRGADLLEHEHLTKGALRAAARTAHPDTGGSVETFQRLQVAADVLKAHHGGRT